MSKVPSPASPPNQADRLAEFAKSLPEPLREVITRYAKHVNIECSAMQVGALQRAAAAHAHQLALLGLIASTAQRSDDQGNAEVARCIDECQRMLCGLRIQCLEQIGCRITQHDDGTEIVSIEAPKGSPWNDSDIAEA